ncbi:peptidylprolyl isomerase [Faucicola mancuniensis]|uniref:peptidylprolyl isomerase n=1 Tax=Faucicola mancuniensis TaxID=1309795 RepID=UPI003977803B
MRIFNQQFLYVAMLSVFALASQNAMAETINSDQTTDKQVVKATDKTLDGVIAVVNDTAILNSELDNAVAMVASQLKAENKAIPPANQMYSQVLNQMISRQIQLDLIKKQGFSVSENELNVALSHIAKQNGMSSLTAFQQKLDSEKAGSYKALRQQVSEDLAIQTLQQQQIARRVKISEQDVDAFLKSPESSALEQSQYRPLHIRVPFTSKAGETPTERQKQSAMTVAEKIAQALQAENANVEQIVANAQKGYTTQIQGGDVGYHTVKELPTDIAQHITSLNIGQVSKPLLTEQGVDVVKLLDKKDGGQHIIDQWQTRHILISPSTTVSAELAKQQIEAIYQQLLKGADFATLAATYSKDGSASNGGSLGWVSEGEMVPAFEAMMKKTEANDFSIPFQTQFGWHILKVDAKRKQDVTDTYRRNVAREVLYQRLAPQALEDWLQELRAQSYVKILQ